VTGIISHCSTRQCFSFGCKPNNCAKSAVVSAYVNNVSGLPYRPMKLRIHRIHQQLSFTHHAAMSRVSDPQDGTFLTRLLRMHSAAKTWSPTSFSSMLTLGCHTPRILQSDHKYPAGRPVGGVRPAAPVQRLVGGLARGSRG